MQGEFKMSLMREPNFFLELQIKREKDGSFIIFGATYELPSDKFLSVCEESLK